MVIIKVRLTPFSDKWAQMFQDEVNNLKVIFEELVTKFEHFGSTSVPGMKAKPVIDMMCIVDEISTVDTFNEKMNALGYDIAGEWGISGRRLFRKGGDNRTHHIHFYQFDNPQIERHLVFRDYLRCHPEEVIRYSLFKEELARKFEHTSAYSPAKKAFVTEIEQLAFTWYAEKPTD